MNDNKSELTGMYRIAYSTSKRGRWQSAYRASFDEALVFAKAQYKALVYSANETLVANLTKRPTNGHALACAGF